MESFAFRKVSELMRPPLIFSSDDKVSALIGELRRSGAHEAIVESRKKPRFITLIDLLKVSDPERTSLGKIAGFAIPIDPEAPVLEAADLMFMSRAWSLIAKRGDDVLGVISQLDIFNSLSDSYLPQNISCGEVMNTEIPHVEASYKLSAARSTMRKRDLIYLPVMEGEKIVGSLSIGDLVFNMLQPRKSARRGDRVGGGIKAWSIPVKSVMNRSPTLVDKDLPLSKALQRMKNLGENACIVHEDLKPLGTVTPREVISIFLRLKPEKRPRIYVLGLPEAGDFLELKTTEDKLARTFDRIFKRYKPIVEVVIDVKRKRIRGERALYQVSARVYLPGRILTLSAKGWYLSKVFDKLCRKLEGMRWR